MRDPAQITTATVQDVKKCLELVEELEATLPKETAQKTEKGITEETRERIIKAMAGEF